MFGRPIWFVSEFLLFYVRKSGFGTKMQGLFQRYAKYFFYLEKISNAACARECWWQHETKSDLTRSEVTLARSEVTFGKIEN